MREGWHCDNSVTNGTIEYPYAWQSCVHCQWLLVMVPASPCFCLCPAGMARPSRASSGTEGSTAPIAASSPLTRASSRYGTQPRCVCVCMRACMCVWRVCVHFCVVCVRACMCVWRECVRECVWRACMHVCVCVCVCVCACVNPFCPSEYHCCASLR